MYQLITSSSFKQLLLQQFPAISISIVLAEMFYKFHSFSLECMAFLLTWGIVDAFISGLLNRSSPRSVGRGRRNR